MAVCAHAQTAIFFLGAKMLPDACRQYVLPNTHRQTRVAGFAALILRRLALRPPTSPIFARSVRFSRQLPGSHDARL
jgi:hypothetical protein